MNFSHLANKLRSKITRFSGILSQDLDKTARRFVREAVYGIMASLSVMLTEIGRHLENRVSLKRREESFSSEGEIVDCYRTKQAIAAEVGSNEATSLHLSLYSLGFPEFTSEINEILAAIDQVGEAVQNSGIWVIV